MKLNIYTFLGFWFPLGSTRKLSTYKIQKTNTLLYVKVKVLLVIWFPIVVVISPVNVSKDIILMYTCTLSKGLGKNKKNWWGGGLGIAILTGTIQWLCDLRRQFANKKQTRPHNISSTDYVWFMAETCHIAKWITYHSLTSKKYLSIILVWSFKDGTNPS